MAASRGAPLLRQLLGGAFLRGQHGGGAAGSDVRALCTASAAEGPGLHLMAVPKRKVTPSRRGIRNGPKALKPVPVIAKCKACGKVKLPHMFCCDGRQKSTVQSTDV